MASIEQMEQDILDMEENRQKALARADAATRATDKERWLASAERYAKLIQLKKEAIERQKRINAIRDRLNNPPSSGGGGGGGGGGNQGTVSPPPAGSNYTPPAVDPTPPAPAPPPPPPPPPPVKVAPIDTIIFDSSVLPIETINDLIFENLSGSELINISRNDTINGQNVIYQPIKNLSSLQRQYNPNNIVSVQSTSDKYFSNFSIKLEEKVPFEGNGEDGRYVYFNNQNGDIVVEAINIQEDEQIEIQILRDGTIYEAEL